MASKKGGKAVEPPPEPVKVEPEIITGTGEFHLADGSKYNGEYKQVDGKKTRDGQGTFTFGPEVYTGQWVNDKMHGKGEYRYASGAIYNGDFFENMMHGQGEYFFPDGAVYKGDWLRNKMHGQGKYEDKEQVVYEGNYVNGMFDAGKSFISLRSVNNNINNNNTNNNTIR
jgi:hypothetical protein